LNNICSHAILRENNEIFWIFLFKKVRKYEIHKFDYDMNHLMKYDLPEYDLPENFYLNGLFLNENTKHLFATNSKNIYEFNYNGELISKKNIDFSISCSKSLNENMLFGASSGFLYLNDKLVNSNNNICNREKILRIQIDDNLIYLIRKADAWEVGASTVDCDVLNMEFKKIYKISSVTDLIPLKNNIIYVYNNSSLCSIDKKTGEEKKIDCHLSSSLNLTKIDEEHFVRACFGQYIFYNSNLEIIKKIEAPAYSGMEKL